MGLPVGMPDEGTFAWLDTFHEKNSGYAELSNRAFLEWARKSNLERNRGWGAKKDGDSNDKPDANYNCSALDNGTVNRYIEDLLLCKVETMSSWKLEEI